MNKLSCVVTVLVVSSAQADTIFVDDDNCPGPGSGTAGDPYCSIQTAIDNVMNRDEIVVAPGIYLEIVNLLGKAITLRSSDGPTVTYIHGLFGGTVVTCDSGEGPDTVLEGFTVTGGSNVVGGGMANIGSSPQVVGCVFLNNDVFGGFSPGLGGGMYNSGGNPTMIDCTFIGNVAGGINVGNGGGMYNEFSNPTLVNCTFRENSAFTTFGRGGAMYNDHSTVVITRCVFEGNLSTEGGGIFNKESNPTIVNCLFDANSAFTGSAMANNPGSPTVTNCTFSGNATDGGGMSNFSTSNPTVTNCILWNNGPHEILGPATVAYCNVEGGVPGIGNVDTDPLFVDPDNGDFWLSPDSPCIDAADNTAVPEDIISDLDGNPRFLDVPETPDTGNPPGGGPIVDMGAYESLGGGCLAVTSQEVVCHADGTTFTVNVEGLNACTGGTTHVTFTGSGGAVGDELCFTALISDGGFCCSTEICVTIPDCSPECDLDGDGVVGILDYLTLLDAWGSCPDCGTPAACVADFDGDCQVGILDFMILLANWTA